MRNKVLTRLYKEFRSLSRSFENLASCAEKLLLDSGVTAAELITFLQNYIQNGDSVSVVMSEIKNRGLLNCEVLESMIRHFDHEGTMTEELEEYMTEFKEYSKKRVCEIPVDAFDSSASSFPRLVAMLGVPFSVSSKLREIKQLQHRIEQKLHSKPLILTRVNVDGGCLQLTFRCSNTLIIGSLSKEHISSLKGDGVLSLILTSDQNSSPKTLGKCILSCTI